MKTLSIAGWIILCALPPLVCAEARAEAKTRRVMALATRDQLFMGIGAFDPKHGWQSYEGLMRPTVPGDVFTLYTMDGEVAQVTNIDEHNPPAWRTPVEWAAHITRWYNGDGEPYALAIPGRSPLVSTPATSLPLDDPETVKQVSLYLQKRGLKVPQPYLTQAYELSLSSGDLKVRLVCAHNDMSALKDKEAAAVYALALLMVPSEGEWKIFPLDQQTSFKPASQSLEDHEQYNGTRDFYRFVAAEDIDGDGWKDMVLYIAKKNFGTQMEVYSFNGKRLQKDLSTFKHLYN